MTDKNKDDAKARDMLSERSPSDRAIEAKAKEAELRRKEIEKTIPKGMDTQKSEKTQSKDAEKEKTPKIKEHTPIPSPEGNEKAPPTEKFITDYDLHLFKNGTHYKIYEKFGAQIITVNGVKGLQFTTWAPNAVSISVIGEFNGWQEGVNEMTNINNSGVWTLFIPGLKEGDTYKYSIKSNVDNLYRRKSDPYAFRSEVRSKDASIVTDINKYKWNDNEWMKKRHLTPALSLLKSPSGQGEGDSHSLDSVETSNSPSPLGRVGVGFPMSIYEVHLGSWKKNYNNKDFPNEWGYLSYGQLAHEIVAYVKEMGYTHIELLPVMEHPLDISWGYQVTCYYAPTSRHGSPEDFMYFVDYCHQNNIGVILDWVPAHFPTDEHSLAYFDGKQIYAYESLKKGVHKDWGTFIFDYGRNEVQNFLIASALFWLDKYHADGLRVDAVASMLYLDYSRGQGEWEPNIHGGRENLEAINFLKHLNDIVHKYHQGVLMIAEESTAWPGVSHPVSEGGLGFDMKWNMGWMNDILSYFKEDPINRKYHQGKLTFSLWYGFSENFILPISHDEVVHGKKSLIEKMPGDTWQKFANLRLFLGFMFGHPGKKLNFMATDIAQYKEWDSESELDWGLLNSDNKRFARSEATKQSQSLNAKFNLFMRDLCHLYKTHPALYEVDFDSKGFQWIDFSDALNSILAFIRISRDEKEILLFTFNMIPTVRYDYAIGVPKPGFWKEILNSDAEIYGGSGIGNMGGKHSQDVPYKEWEYSIKVTLPPLGVNVFKREK